MDVQTSAERFDEAVSTLPEEIRKPLLGVPRSVKAGAFEVRLRVGQPVSIICSNRTWFVDKDSQLHNIPRHCVRISAEDMQQAVVSMCSFSVHSHQQELADGYISLRGGHRAGVCGTAVLTHGEITAVRDIASLNLRIAREVQGCASNLIKQLFADGLCGVLVVGAPSSGKTTLLRDLIRQLANGSTRQYTKIAVVDERGEIGAVHEGIPQNDLGISCDVLNGYPKGAGIQTAVRTLSPQVIVCDEIGAKEEVDSMLDGLGCGVTMIASAHASSIKELLTRRQIVRLLRQGAFSKIVRLGPADTPGKVEEIAEVGDLFHDEDPGAPSHRAVLDGDGNLHGWRAVPASEED